MLYGASITVVWNLRIYASARAATPGKIFPSNSSKEAPPPVLFFRRLENSEKHRNKTFDADDIYQRTLARLT